MKRYIVGFLLTITLIIIVIVLLISGGNSKPTKKVADSGKTLDSYAQTDAQVRLTIDGPVTAAETHRQIQITVDRNGATLDIIRGYNGEVIKEQKVAGTEEGYSAFLHSLELSNYTKGDTSDDSLKSETGHCPQGDRYVYEILQDGKVIQHYWSTNCGGVRTYLGSVQAVLNLYEAQIPDYYDAISPNQQYL